MNGRIFTAYHFVPDEYRADDLYSPVIMGCEVGNRPGLLSDLHGDAPHYAPLTTAAGFDEICAKWYVWKNLLSKYDWFGFQQYRRPLDFGGRSNDEIRALVEQYDIITCGPDETTKENPNIRQSFKQHWPNRVSAWDTFEKLMGPDWSFTMPLNRPHNVWVMRADEFGRYMTKWSEVFLELAKIERPDPPRVYGYLTERFFAIYLDRLTRERPDMKVLVLPGIQTAALAAQFRRGQRR
jgi:hypothetical protein